MPTYEYQCKKCSHRFEQWQKMTDEPLAICPACGGIIRRVYYPTGIVFKGSGFYKTDSNGHATKDEDGVAAAATSESGNGSTSGESKPPAAASGPKSTDTATSENKVTAPTPT